MPDSLFKDMRDQMVPDQETLSRLETALEVDFIKESEVEGQQFGEGTSLREIEGKGKGGNPKKNNRNLRLLLYSAAALILLSLSGVVVYKMMPQNPQGTTGGSTGTEVVEIAPQVVVENYQAIYRALDEASASNNWFYSYSFSRNTEMGAAEDADVLMEMEMAVPESPAAMDTASGAKLSALGNSGSGYSETNVQVEGIDEGDIIKTDGSFIYVISNNQLIILKASGADTEEVSRIQITNPDEDGSYRDFIQELYIKDSTAVIVLNHSDYPTTRGGYYKYEPGTKTLCYDISDPSYPEKITEFYQSGYFVSSRLKGEVLYLISSYAIYDDLIEDDPSTYVPAIGEEDSIELVRCDDIRILPVIVSATYTVITSIDVATQNRIDQLSVLGSTETVYMSSENLFLASSVYTSDVKEAYQESVYTVEEHVDRITTQLMRISLNHGQMDTTAQCIVEGSLLNQFSLDEYNGNLRLVVTTNNFSYRIFRDEDYGIEHIQYTDDFDQTNALYILDQSLSLLGSIEGLAKDERIYSARFVGPVGYMVTFRQVDPLFALDLSDPTDPLVTSELKIPGFSTYLHPYGQDLLLGLGYDADSTRTSGMKISMFDTSDPYDVWETDIELIDIYSSEALYNHKAVLVDVDLNIIGFPSDQYRDYGSEKQYFVYSYEDSGFVLRGRLDLSSSSDGYHYFYNGGIRGLYIGYYLYVFSGEYLDVFDLESLDHVLALQLQEYDGSGYHGIMPYMILE